jgi:hypothetical protein
MRDTIWITIPDIYIPETCGNIQGNEVSETYKRVYQAYQEYNKPAEDDLELPVELKLDSDELAAEMIGRLLRKGISKEDISFLADCRSSVTGKVPAPTYKAAVLNGLKDITPFSVQNQAGTEFFQAVMILREMMAEKNYAMGCVSAVQKLNKGDRRKEAHFYPFGDGAASVLVRREANQGFQILDLAVRKVKDISEDKICQIVKDIFCQKDFDRKEPDWIVSQSANESMNHIMKEIFPSASILSRKKYPEIDFGCADVLISLTFLSEMGELENDSLGCAVFLGRTKHIGIMLLHYVKED